MYISVKMFLLRSMHWVRATAALLFLCVSGQIFLYTCLVLSWSVCCCWHWISWLSSTDVCNHACYNLQSHGKGLFSFFWTKENLFLKNFWLVGWLLVVDFPSRIWQSSFLTFCYERNRFIARDGGACYIYARRPVSQFSFAGHAYLFYILRHYRCSKRALNLQFSWWHAIPKTGKNVSLFLSVRRLILMSWNFARNDRMISYS